MKFTEQRIKLTNEALQGIRVVKLYGWETPIEERIANIRDSELQLVSKQRYLKMINSILQFLAPVFAPFILFVIIAYVDRDGGNF